MLSVSPYRERKTETEKERKCFYVWVKQTEEKRDMQIYINLIMLLVPRVFLLELTAGRDWRDIERKRDTEKETEIDSLIH